MDIAWLILDSLSFSATPFGASGPETMPRLAGLAEESGVVYTNAYVPGPTSPSSHGSLFTGEPPSITGMHEAHPYFDSDARTIGESLSDSHRSMLISANPYVFNGLDRGFDVSNDLREEEYMIFSGAGNPGEFKRNTQFETRWRKYYEYVTSSSQPMRSLVNAVQYKRVMRKRRSSLPERSTRDDDMFQYANEMNARIRSFVRNNDGPSFVVANYMDIHPPLDASAEAIDRFRREDAASELPIGVRGQDVYEQYRDGNEEVAERMYTLLQATIWDTDRKVAPLVSSLLERGAIVVVTADHGSWFRRDTELDDERIHVPLIVFAPERRARRVEHTVNIRSVPRTTLNVLDHPEKDAYSGRDLLSVDDDEVSITEFVHTANEDGKPINPTGGELREVRFDMAAIRGTDRLDYVDRTFVNRSGANARDLRDEIAKRLSNDPLAGRTHHIQYDDAVEQRLKDFGYL